MSLIDTIVWYVTTHIDVILAFWGGALLGSMLLLHHARRSIENHQQTLLLTATVMAHVETFAERLIEELSDEEMRELVKQANRRAHEYQIDMKTGHAENIENVEVNQTLSSRVLSRLFR